VTVGAVEFDHKAYYLGAHQLRITGDRQTGRLLGAQLLGHHRAEVAAARVNLSEADSFGNHCVVARSSFGWLIQTAVGSGGGSGGLRTKRSGCWA
jgi:hypothetical protein